MIINHVVHQQSVFSDKFKPVVHMGSAAFTIQTLRHMLAVLEKVWRSQGKGLGVVLFLYSYIVIMLYQMSGRSLIAMFFVTDRWRFRRDRS